MVQIVYVEKNGTKHRVNAETGSNLMQVAVDNGIDSIAGECGGGMSCATCLCHVDDEWLNTVGSADGFERDMIDLSTEPQANSRLGCQVKITEEYDGLVVHLPESQF